MQTAEIFPCGGFNAGLGFLPAPSLYLDICPKR